MTPSNSSVDQAIRLLYGQTVFKYLIKATVSSEAFRSHELRADSDIDGDGDVGMNLNEDDEEVSYRSSTTKKKKKGAWAAELFFTNISYQSKKMVFLLFINRECRSIFSEACL